MTAKRCDEGWARLLAMPVPPGGMSQEEVAAVVGCRLQNIQHVERAALNKVRWLWWKQGARYADLAPDGAPPGLAATEWAEQEDGI